jgi:hypothetical protein
VGAVGRVQPKVRAGIDASIGARVDRCGDTVGAGAAESGSEIPAVKVIVCHAARRRRREWENRRPSIRFLATSTTICCGHEKSNTRICRSSTCVDVPQYDAPK